MSSPSLQSFADKCTLLQVVHHPTIIAMHGEGESWSFSADADVRAKFWGRSVELLPIGLIRLRFDDGDEYNWAKVRLATRLSRIGLQ